jgi:hypothetical protein
MPATGEKEGEMPREKFWQTDHADRQEPDLTVRWAHEVLFVQGDILITSDEEPEDLDRLIRSLKRARRALGFRPLR